MSPDAPGFEQIVGGVMALWARKGVRYHDLQDMAQTARLALWRYDGPYPFTVAKRAVIDTLRVQYGRNVSTTSTRTCGNPSKAWGRYELLILDATGEADYEAEFGDTIKPYRIGQFFAAPECEVERDSTRMDAVWETLDCMQERDRELLKLIHFDELTQREVAKRWGVTESRVCHLHQRARARFQAAWIRIHRGKAA